LGGETLGSANGAHSGGAYSPLGDSGHGSRVHSHRLNGARLPDGTAALAPALTLPGSLGHACGVLFPITTVIMRLCSLR